MTTALDFRASFFFNSICRLQIDVCATDMTICLVWTMTFSRSTLVELGCFGDPASQMKELLLEAWEDYRAWCKEQKVNTGQGRFTPGLATQICAMCNLLVAIVLFAKYMLDDDTWIPISCNGISSQFCRSGIQTSPWSIHDCKGLEWTGDSPVVVGLFRCCFLQQLPACRFSTCFRPMASQQWIGCSGWACVTSETCHVTWPQCWNSLNLCLHMWSCIESLLLVATTWISIGLFCCQVFFDSSKILNLSGLFRKAGKDGYTIYIVTVYMTHALPTRYVAVCLKLTRGIRFADILVWLKMLNDVCCLD